MSIYGSVLNSCFYILVPVVSPGTRKQKLGVTFNSDKLGVIYFSKISKLIMCRASEACTANIFNVIFTVFKCVPISTVISLYV